MKSFRLFISAYTGGLLVGVMLGFPAGWNAYRVVDAPAVSNIKTMAGTYPDWMRRQMAREVYWINVEFKAKAKKGKV